MNRLSIRFITIPIILAAAFLAAPAHAYCPSIGASSHYSNLDCYLDASSFDPITYTSGASMPSDVYLEGESYCINLMCEPGYVLPDPVAMISCDDMGNWGFSAGSTCVELDCTGAPPPATGYEIDTCSGTTAGSTCMVSCTVGYSGSPNPIACHAGQWGAPAGCTPAICEENEYVLNHICTACPAGSANESGDDATGADTACIATLCGENEYVLNHVCTACPAGSTNESGDDATGADTACIATLCGENEYVLNHICTACPAGSTNESGDDATGADTACIATLCGENEYVLNHI
ncbi:hypothetical protein KKF34_19695, partial [Myxococcota bacterium]|nr:hypothetical protein [Myxococcota bacterium]